MVETIHPSSLEGKKILNFGLTRPIELPTKLDITTIPIIRIQKQLFSQCELAIWHKNAKEADVWLFSSKTAVSLFFTEYPFEVGKKELISVGSATTQELMKWQSKMPKEAIQATQEGMLKIICKEIPKQSFLFWPRSSVARPFLGEELVKAGYRLREMPLYSPVYHFSSHPVDLTFFDALLFTSPSTFDAYFAIYGAMPCTKSYLCIGPITHQHGLSRIKNACGKDLPEILMLGTSE